MPLLDEWFPGAAESAGHRRRRGRWGRLVAAALAVGVAASLLAVPAVGGAGLGAREAVRWWRDLPTDLPLTAPLPQRSVVYARDGRTVIATFYGENRVPVPMSDLPRHLVEGVLAVEDDRFYEHGAVDVRGTLRAVVNNAGGGFTQGGSTITQQYVKNLLLGEADSQQEKREVTERTLSRKLREARMAVEAEARLGKDGVLEAYLNTVYFGRGAYGVGAAAERYFGVPAARLGLAQAATLVGMLKSPSRYDPVDRPERALARRNVVLDRMVSTGRLDRERAAAAKAAPLGVRLTSAANGCGRSRYPFFCQLVRDTLADDPAFGATPQARSEFLYRGGLRIVTTLDPTAMAVAQRAVDTALPATGRAATALAVVVPGTGEVPAIATNRRWGVNTRRGQTELVLPALPRFQPGSTFKPVTLATALEQGLSPYSRLDTPDGYVPDGLAYPTGGFHNSDDRGHGRLDAFQATKASVNTYFVQLIERTGVLPVADMAARLGITSLPRTGRRAIGPRDASLTLGTAEVSPLELAGAYATFAAHGVACRPVVIRRITRTDGTAVAVPSPGCHQAVSTVVADTVAAVLVGSFDPGGTANGLALAGRPAAGKTGTTNESGATWFAGFTPQRAAAVWVGDTRGPAFPLRDVTAYGESREVVYGRTIAGPIWRDAMAGLHRRLPVQQFARLDPALAAGARPSVPDVRGLDTDAAATVLRSAGYRVVVDRVTAAADPLLPADRVVEQRPAGGSAAGPGSEITLVLTDGSRTDVIVPGPAAAGAG